MTSSVDALRAPELILELMRQHGISREDVLARFTVPLEPWVRDQVDAASRENRQTVEVIAVCDPGLAGGAFFEQAASDATVAGLIAMYNAIAARKVWWCPHFVRATRTGVFDEPFTAGIAEGLAFCERERCTLGALGKMRAYQPDQRCDVCDRLVPDNHFTPHLATHGPLRVKFSACDACHTFYRETRA